MQFYQYHLIILVELIMVNMTLYCKKKTTIISFCMVCFEKIAAELEE